LILYVGHPRGESFTSVVTPPYQRPVHSGRRAMLVDIALSPIGSQMLTNFLSNVSNIWTCVHVVMLKAICTAKQGATQQTLRSSMST
jgi:hypothetical protein